ncbi:MAG: sensor histidine kinase [Thermoleophilaceae bacterium]|nr:sensor histidine kinase [Thermoleophilaceae bacterium]
MKSLFSARTPRLLRMHAVDGMIVLLCAISLASAAASDPLALDAGLVAAAAPAMLLLRGRHPVAAPLIALWLFMLPQIVQPDLQVSYTVGGMVFWACVLVAAAGSRGRSAFWSWLTIVVANASITVADRTTTSEIVEETLWGGVLIAGVFIAAATFRRQREQHALLKSQAAQLRESADIRAQLAASDERLRIARDLHDVVAHSLSAMVLQAGGARRVVDSDPASAADALASIEATGREAMVEVRRVLGELRENDDARLEDPLPAIERLVESLRGAGMEITLETPGEVGAVPASVAGAAFRIVQEGLTNARRHAADQPVRLTLEQDDENLMIEIVNPMPTAAGQGRGFGLVGMRERAERLGGSLELTRGTDHELRAALPLGAAATVEAG